MVINTNENILLYLQSLLPQEFFIEPHPNGIYCTTDDKVFDDEEHWSYISMALGVKYGANYELLFTPSKEGDANPRRFFVYNQGGKFRQDSTCIMQ